MRWINIASAEGGSSFFIVFVIFCSLLPWTSVMNQIVFAR
jgi:hypothetical protein